MVLMPDDADVESTAAELFVDDRPVESEPTLLALVLMPDDADVESRAAELFVDDSPLESEVTPL